MSQNKKKALIILTSHTELGSTGRKTGFYYDEMATPYWRLIDAGFDVDIGMVSRCCCRCGLPWSIWIIASQEN